MSNQPNADLETIRQRWSGVEWTYGEDQGQCSVFAAYLLQNGRRLFETEEPLEDERAILQRCGAAPGDVQALLARTETAEANACYAIQALARVDAERLAALDRAEQARAAEADEIKALLIEMRRYFISHNCPTGECVAWTDLKARFGVGVRDEVDEEWMAAHTGKPFQLRRSADEQPRRRGE